MCGDPTERRLEVNFLRCVSVRNLAGRGAGFRPACEKLSFDRPLVPARGGQGRTGIVLEFVPMPSLEACPAASGELKCS
jgi:hypothetical protein